jgi:hypothetical protein
MRCDLRSQSSTVFTGSIRKRVNPNLTFHPKKRAIEVASEGGEIGSRGHLGVQVDGRPGRKEHHSKGH